MTPTIDKAAVLDRPAVVAAGAVTFGVALDLLAWGRPAGPGLTVTLLGAIGLAWWTLAHHRRAGAAAHALLGTAALMAVVPTFRASEVLTFLAVVAAALIAVVVVGLPGGRRLPGWTIGTYLRAVGRATESIVEGGRFVGTDLVSEHRTVLSRVARLIPVVRGVVIATILVVFFGMLFGSADPVFARIVSDALDVDLSFGRIVRFGVVVAGAGWLAAGYLRTAVRGGPDHTTLVSRVGSRIEAMVVLGALNALFAGFVTVQFAYFFDGDASRASLGYAEYARRGFFELVAVAAFVTALVLAVDWLVQHGRRSRWVDGLHALLVAQTFVVMASALSRMLAYTRQFGLSELRIYTTAFMAWTGLVLVWLVLTVLRGRRDAFALGAFVTGLAMIVALVVLNPDATIARVNLSRAVAGAELDIAYLSRLSSDAVPVIIELAPEVASGAGLDATLDLERDELEAFWTDHGWRSWSWADFRARQVLGSEGSGAA